MIWGYPYFGKHPYSSMQTALCVVCVLMGFLLWLRQLVKYCNSCKWKKLRSCNCWFEKFGKSCHLRRAFSHPARLGFALKVLQLLFVIGDSSLQHFSEVRPVGALLRFRLAPAQYMAMTMESVTQVLPAMEFKASKYHHVTVHWLFAMKQVAEMVQDTLNHQEEAKAKTLADILVCRVTIATLAMSGGDYCQWLFFILPSWGDHFQKQAMSWWRGLRAWDFSGRFDQDPSTRPPADLCKSEVRVGMGGRRWQQDLMACAVSPPEKVV